MQIADNKADELTLLCRIHAIFHRKNIRDLAVFVKRVIRERKKLKKKKQQQKNTIRDTGGEDEPDLVEHES